MPEAQQVVLVGNQRSFVAALITAASTNGAGNVSANNLTEANIQSAIDAMNATVPHYKKIRAFCILPEPFSIENGLLTTNGKIKRGEIVARYAGEIETLYEKKPA